MTPVLTPPDLERSAEIQRAVRDRLLLHTALATQNANVSGLGLIVLLWVILAGQHRVTTGLGYWTSALCALFIACGVLVRRMVGRIEQAGSDTGREQLRLCVLLVVSGTTWGSLTFVIPPTARHQGSVSVLFAITAIVMVGNLVFSAGSTGPFVSLHLSLTGVALAGTMLAGNWQLALLTSFTASAAFVLRGDLHATMHEATVLAIRNELLAADLSRANEALALRAVRDPLTGVANRDVLVERLRAAVATATPEHRPGVVYFDIDRFKSVNDVHGHAAGDTLLQQASARVAACLDSDETLCRLGGDEFVVLVIPATPARVLGTGSRVHAAFAEPFVVDGTTTLRSTASVGVACWDNDATAKELLARADAALYQAKRLGRDRVQVWQPL